MAENMIDLNGLVHVWSKVKTLTNGCVKASDLLRWQRREVTMTLQISRPYLHQLRWTASYHLHQQILCKIKSSMLR